MKRILEVYLISFVQIVSSCYQRAEPETYLIPSNFTGEVNILFNQNGVPTKYKNEYGQDTIYTPKIGNPMKYENGRRVYEIPSNGILLTQFKKNDGFIDRQYYSIDRDGNRILLEVFKFEHLKKDSTKYIVKDKSQKGIFGDGTIGSYGNMNIAFQDFIVSNYTELDSFYTKEYRNDFDSKIEKITGLIFNLK